jgi:hypothetical protein
MIYIYSPQMLVVEKLRAICQQLPAYQQIVPSQQPRARAKDFYDIYLICVHHDVLPLRGQDFDMVRAIFSAKRVPLSFMCQIGAESGRHGADWQSVGDTLSAKEELLPFKFYLDFVINSFGNLATL